MTNHNNVMFTIVTIKYKNMKIQTKTPKKKPKTKTKQKHCVVLAFITTFAGNKTNKKNPPSTNKRQFF
jgi:hypothetical protein